MEDKLSRVHIVVSGRVQGVFFRAYARDQARELRLTGWVRNLPDQRVEIDAEGEEKKLQALVLWCQEGPPSARVDKVDVEWQPYSNEFKVFEVRY